MRNAHSRSIVPWYCAVKISNLTLSSQISAPLAQDKVAETSVVSAESSGEGSGNFASGFGRAKIKNCFRMLLLFKWKRRDGDHKGRPAF